MKTYPKNPRLPEPEFVTATMPWAVVYGWKCDKHGIMVFGDTAKEAQATWLASYNREYFS